MWSCPQLSWPLCFIKQGYYKEKFDAAWSLLGLKGLNWTSLNCGRIKSILPPISCECFPIFWVDLYPLQLPSFYNFNVFSYTFRSWNLGNSLMKISLIMSGSATIKKGWRNRYILGNKKQTQFPDYSDIYLWVLQPASRLGHLLDLLLVVQSSYTRPDTLSQPLHAYCQLGSKFFLLLGGGHGWVVRTHHLAVPVSSLGLATYIYKNFLVDHPNFKSLPVGVFNPVMFCSRSCCN